MARDNRAKGAEGGVLLYLTIAGSMARAMREDC